MRRDLLGSLLRCEYHMYLEINQVAPVRHPLIQQSSVVGFHQLIAALELVIDPARHISQALRSHPAAIPKPAIHGYEIGRASCRERVKVLVVAGLGNKKKESKGCDGSSIA